MFRMYSEQPLALQDVASSPHHAATLAAQPSLFGSPSTAAPVSPEVCGICVTQWLAAQGWSPKPKFSRSSVSSLTASATSVPSGSRSLHAGRTSSQRSPQAVSQSRHHTSSLSQSSCHLSQSSSQGHDQKHSWPPSHMSSSWSRPSSGSVGQKSSSPTLPRRKRVRRAAARPGLTLVVEGGSPTARVTAIGASPPGAATALVTAIARMSARIVLGLLLGVSDEGVTPRRPCRSPNRRAPSLGSAGDLFSAPGRFLESELVSTSLQSEEASQ